MAVVVVDTNVLLSAAANAPGTPGRAIERLLRHHTVAQSKETFTEFKRTLLRPAFDASLSRRARLAYIERIRRASVVFVVEAGLPVSRDPRDDMFLHLAITAHADAIVTGDQDLLVLSIFSGIPILTPSGFLRAERFVRRRRTIRPS